MRHQVTILSARKMGLFDIADGLSTWQRIEEEEGVNLSIREMATRTFGYGGRSSENQGRVDGNVNANGVDFFSYAMRCRTDVGFR